MDKSNDFWKRMIYGRKRSTVGAIIAFAIITVMLLSTNVEAADEVVIGDDNRDDAKLDDGKILRTEGEGTLYISVEKIVSMLDIDDVMIYGNNSITIYSAINAASNFNSSNLTLDAKYIYLYSGIELKSDASLSEDGHVEIVEVHSGAFIQNGISLSTSGKRISVYPGLYRESILIDKEIVLEGQNRDSTIIDGMGVGNVVEVKAGLYNVEIENITIENGGMSQGDAGIYISKASELERGNIIDEVIIKNCYHGILMEYDCKNNLIQCCTIEDCHQGISLLYGCRTNTIQHNTILNIGINEERYRSFGILSYKSGGNIIFHNRINNVDHIGINVENSMNENREPVTTIIKKNYIENCSNQGVVIAFSDGNAIENNYFKNNGKEADKGAGFDLFIERCYENEVRHNNFMDGQLFSDSEVTFRDDYRSTIFDKNWWWGNSKFVKSPLKIIWGTDYISTNPPSSGKIKDYLIYFFKGVFPWIPNFDKVLGVDRPWPMD